MITTERWWTGPDTGPFAAWVADRAAAEPTHGIRVDAVGRDAAGRFVVRAEALRGTRLPDALDRIGVPSVGVAVTLTVPLLELAVDGRSGAVLLGDARPEDVLVDDAGVTVLVDRPPDASDPTVLADAHSRPSPSHAVEHPGATALVLAVRSVWERVDPREPCRAAVDQAIAESVHGGVDDVRRLLDVVRATGPPRPVRWEPPRDVFDFAAPVEPTLAGAGSGAGSGAASGVGSDVGEALRRVVEHGVRLPGSGRRVPARMLVVGAVVAVGMATAGILALGAP